MCGNPQCRHILTLELHHIVWVRDGGGNEPRNLIALCPNCHSLHTAAHIPSEAVRVWKAMLLFLTAITRSNVDHLIHLHRQAQNSFGKCVRYSGDTLLLLAPLLNAGLIETGSAEASSGGAGFPPYSSFEVHLTDVGRDVVEAWLAGDEARFNAAIEPKKGV